VLSWAQDPTLMTSLQQRFSKVLKGRAVISFTGFLCVKCSSFKYYWRQLFTVCVMQ